MKPKRLVSLCSGVGGLELALTAEPVMFADINKHSQQVLAAHYDVPQLADWTELDTFDDFNPDILTAGLPCQPISFIGKKRGDQDDRYLFDEMIALLERSRSRPALLLENVRAFGLSSYAQQRARLIVSLTKLGYEYREVILSASEVGAPHLRRRWFAAAIQRGESWREFGELGKPVGEVYHKDISLLLPTPMADSSRLFATPTFSPLLPEAIVGFEKSPDRRIPNWPLSDKNGEVADGEWCQHQSAISTWSKVVGRPPPRVVALPNPPWLSSTFTEWLMGFPENWIGDLVPPRAALRLCGNAVVPQQAALAVKRLADKQTLWG